MTSEQVRQRLWKSVDNLVRCTLGPTLVQIRRQTVQSLRPRVKIQVWLDESVVVAVRAEAIKTVLDAREER